METTEGLEVKEEELHTGDVIIWQYRGAPYEAEIREVHGMQYLHGLVCNNFYIRFSYVYLRQKANAKSQCQAEGTY